METMNPKVSRRKLLERTGVGVAALWAAPFVASTASAGVSPVGLKCKPCKSLCGSASCGNDFNGRTCFCFPQARSTTGVGKKCVCSGNFFCSNPHATPCTSDGQCPPGWPCTFNCCGRVCTPPCGLGDLSVSGAGGKTAAG
jgi:hypothetical protein